MAKLSTEQKIFIIQQLACFKTPTETAQLVTLEFGIEIDRRQIAKYDPTNKNSQLSGELKPIFDEIRKAFVTEVASIGIAHPAYRLRELQEMYHRHNSAARKNDQMLLSILKEAREETGDKFAQEMKLADRRAKINGANTNPQESTKLGERQKYLDAVQKLVEAGDSERAAWAFVVKAYPVAERYYQERVDANRRAAEAVMTKWMERDGLSREEAQEALFAVKPEVREWLN